jgi:hypothetical protein
MEHCIQLDDDPAIPARTGWHCDDCGHFIADDELRSN